MYFEININLVKISRKRSRKETKKTTHRLETKSGN